MTKPTNARRLYTIPLELSEVNALVQKWHRHHKPVQGHRYSIGCVDDHGALRGAVAVGRPVARPLDTREVLEVTRLVSDGTPNVCSFLYSAAARVGKELGYRKIQTYIIADKETGTSLKASGWKFEQETRGGQWIHTDGQPRRQDQPTDRKARWSKILPQRRPELVETPARYARPKQ